MIEFMQENAAWVVPITVAVITGVFALFKKQKDSRSIKNGDITNSHVNNINGDVNVSKK